LKCRQPRAEKPTPTAVFRLKAFVGEDDQSPHIDPAEAELVQSRTIKHYELVQT
jgi:hypothetical protein